MTSSLRGKVAIVTGASSGLGEALALELAKQGADLALFSFDQGRQEQVAARCRELGVKAVAVIGDVTSYPDCARLAATTIAELGRIDYLLANAGISMWAPFTEVDDTQVLRRLMEVNFMGAVNCVHAALPQLTLDRGMIIAITSIQSKIGVPMHTGYVASKAALQGFCDSLRLELDGTGVDILTVLPHWLRGTELRRHALGADGAALGDQARKHSSQSVTVDEAAAAILTAMVRRQRELYIPWKLKLLAALNLLLPSVAERIIKGAMRKQSH